MTALLEIRNVTKVFGSGFLGRERTMAVEEISLAISGDPPSIITIAGESGSGKTTLARLLLGIIPPTSGQVLYKGKELTRMSLTEWRGFRREVQAIFQDPFEVYNPFYKVDHALTAPVGKFRLARSGAEMRQLIEDALQGVGLRPEETLGRYPHELSGGQRQRVMMARALLLKPRIILADEPVSMIDASLRATILESLLKLNRELGISLIYITHDLTTAYQVSENIVVLYQGSVAEVGDVELVIKRPQHPYTQLLVSSIPLPNPELKWARGERRAAGGEAPVGASRRCKFADRCPFVMPICYESLPPLFRTDRHRAVACYLYKESPTVAGEEMVSIFARQPPNPGAT
ncbi:MAG: ABC transporter ATP-binding protein [Chloroflexota bacterium]|nr:ABC transporter ATP-binding protein [Chloroflexota bacterium]